MVQTLHHPPPVPATPRRARAASVCLADIAFYLDSALPASWAVERIIDPEGEAALLVLAEDDDPALPCFLLFDKGFVPHIAVIAEDAWLSERHFASWPDAAQAIVAMAVHCRYGAEGAGTMALAQQPAGFTRSGCAA